jgi:aspartate kinase
MRVFKFGGASVKDAGGVRNLAKIVGMVDEPLVVVVSAMGKTTNAFEALLKDYMNRDKPGVGSHFGSILEYHQNIIDELMGRASQYQPFFDSLVSMLHNRLLQEPSLNYDFEYDQIVSFGELLSTSIVSGYLNSSGILNKWIDIRQCLKTDDTYRDAGVNWELTSKFVKDTFAHPNHRLYITQGFIGSTINNLTTTLGREGSDYTAAILGHILDSENVTIWKDVPGVLSSDPRWYPKAQLIPEISYWEAIELTYYGAQVIHPKTLKPLQNKKIPLLVKSFVDPSLPGTIIHKLQDKIDFQPIIIRKTGQVMIYISPRDFSFIMEDNLSDIFAVFGKLRIKVNLMHNSALKFSVCIDSTRLINELIANLNDKYNVTMIEDLELVNIRFYNQATIDEVIQGRDVVDTQITSTTARYVVKAGEWKFS